MARKVRRHTHKHTHTHVVGGSSRRKRKSSGGTSVRNALGQFKKGHGKVRRRR